MKQSIRQNYRKTPAVLPEIFEEYLTHHNNNNQFKPSQIKNIKRILLIFNKYLARIEINIENLKSTHIDNFLFELKQRLCSSTCRLYIYYIRKFVKYLYQNRGILNIDLSKLMILNPATAYSFPPKYFLDSEIKGVFDNIKLSSKRDIRTYCILHLSYAFGLLPRETCMITLDDINFRKREINLRSRCYENNVMLPLSDKTIKAIALYIINARPRNAHRALFLKIKFPYEPLSPSSICNDLNRVLHKANGASSYWLRHTYAKQLIDMGATNYEIKEMLGYEKIKTAERYLRINLNLMKSVLFDEII